MTQTSEPYSLRRSTDDVDAATKLSNKLILFVNKIDFFIYKLMYM